MQVTDILSEAEPAACSINLGEVLYRQMRAVGHDVANGGIEALRADLVVIEPDWSLVEAAARVKAGGGLSYADAFCVATAERLEAELWTGDPEIVERAGELSCEVRDLRAPSD
jgi:predicted nucleic acid-binding protein